MEESKPGITGRVEKDDEKRKDEVKTKEGREEHKEDMIKRERGSKRRKKRKKDI